MAAPIGETEEFWKKLKTLQDIQHESEKKRIDMELQLNRTQLPNNNAIAVKTTQLQAYFKKICDDERRSQIRNEILLRDLQRVQDHTAEMQRKTEQLQVVKVNYEQFLEEKYPHWKEKALHRLQLQNPSMCEPAVSIQSQSQVVPQHQQPAPNYHQSSSAPGDGSTFTPESTQPAAWLSPGTKQHMAQPAVNINRNNIKPSDILHVQPAVETTSVQANSSTSEPIKPSSQSSRTYEVPPRSHKKKASSHPEPSNKPNPSNAGIVPTYHDPAPITSHHSPVSQLGGIAAMFAVSSSVAAAVALPPTRAAQPPVDAEIVASAQTLDPKTRGKYKSPREEVVVVNNGPAASLGVDLPIYSPAVATEDISRKVLHNVKRSPAEIAQSNPKSIPADASTTFTAPTAVAVSRHQATSAASVVPPEVTAPSVVSAAAVAATTAATAVAYQQSPVNKATVSPSPTQDPKLRVSATSAAGNFTDRTDLEDVSEFEDDLTSAQTTSDARDKATNINSPFSTADNKNDSFIITQISSLKDEFTNDGIEDVDNQDLLVTPRSLVSLDEVRRDSLIVGDDLRYSASVASLTQTAAYQKLFAENLTETRVVQTDTETEDEIEKELRSHKHSALNSLGGPIKSGTGASTGRSLDTGMVDSDDDHFSPSTSSRSNRPTPQKPLQPASNFNTANDDDDEFW